jgi:acetyl esterase
MVLHPKAQQLLDRLNAQGVAAIERLPLERRRAVIAGIAPLAGCGAPIDTVRAISIPGRGGSIPARMYRPREFEPLPVVVYFHGGGWTTGNLEIGDALCRALAEGTRAVVVNVAYRLAPEARYPAAADDAYDATRWVCEHAPALGGDGVRVAVTGESAGGNLAAATALRFRDEGRPGLSFQLLMYPSLDSSMTAASYESMATGYLLTRDLMAAAWNDYAGGRLDDPYVSPLVESDLRGLPPTLVISAEFDPLRDEGALYVERLRDCGVDARATCYPGMIHGFVGMSSLFTEANDAIAQSVDVLRRAFTKD